MRRLIQGMTIRFCEVPKTAGDPMLAHFVLSWGRAGRSASGRGACPRKILRVVMVCIPWLVAATKIRAEIRGAGGVERQRLKAVDPAELELVDQCRCHRSQSVVFPRPEPASLSQRARNVEHEVFAFFRRIFAQEHYEYNCRHRRSRRRAATRRPPAQDPSQPCPGWPSVQAPARACGRPKDCTSGQTVGQGGASTFTTHCAARDR